MIRFAFFLKVDFQTTASGEQEALAKKFSGNGLKLIGKRIETREEFRRAKRAAYAMFQAFFFLRPQIVVARDLPASKLNSLRLLQESAAPELRYGEIEEILKQEPALLYKLLRYLNSPALGLYREVRSVPHGVALLGETEFRRWVSVVAVVAASMDEPVEVLRCALTRAYFCEGLAQLLFARANSSEFFFMGLFSLLDVLFARPLAEILDELPVSDGVRSALTGGSNVFHDIYEATLTYEQANWNAFHDAASRAELNQALVTEKYEAAVRQALRARRLESRVGALLQNRSSGRASPRMVLISCQPCARLAALSPRANRHSLIGCSDVLTNSASIEKALVSSA